MLYPHTDNTYAHMMPVHGHYYLARLFEKWESLQMIERTSIVSSEIDNLLLIYNGTDLPCCSYKLFTVTHIT